MKLRELNLPMNTDNPPSYRSDDFDLFTGLFAPDMFYSFFNFWDSDSGVAKHYDLFIEELYDEYDRHFENNKDITFVFKAKLSKLEFIKEDVFKEDQGKIYYSPKPVDINNKGKAIHLLGKIELDHNGDKQQQYAAILYRYLNAAIDLLKESLTSHRSPTLPKKPVRQKLKGFTAKYPGCLPDAFNQLVSFGYILDNSESDNFRDTFLEKIPKKKIQWQKGPGSLSYFIKELNGDGIIDIKKEIWTITIECFSDKDGNPFTKEQLRHAKRPTNIKKLDEVINTFKEFIKE